MKNTGFILLFLAWVFAVFAGALLVFMPPIIAAVAFLLSGFFGFWGFFSWFGDQFEFTHKESVRQHVELMRELREIRRALLPSIAPQPPPQNHTPPSGTRVPPQG